jgi:hypothetical protein
MVPGDVNKVTGAKYRDIRSDLRERLEATVQQRHELNARVRALEAQEQRLRALLNDEEYSQLHQLPQSSCPLSSELTSGGRLREFVLGSLKDGHDWSLQDLKEHARGLGLATIGASGRSLNITLVNLLREGLVMRLRNGRWRYQDQATQLPLDLAPASTGSSQENAVEQLAS